MRKTIMMTVLLACWAWHTPRVEADVKLHGLFTDNMVLQRDMQVPVWGNADPGETVNVAFEQKFPADSKVVSIRVAGPVKADAKGRWVFMLPPRKTGGTATLTVKGKNNTVTVKDILIGEVWIASGQSNMEWSLQQTRDPKDVIANSKNANIRLFDVPKIPNAEPQTELGVYKDPPKGNRKFGQWLECGPDSVPTFSAVGYYFGRKLQKDLDVPVVIINSSWGGTAAQRWTSKSVLESTPELKGLKGSDLYNGMIVPLQPMAFRGVIWYQGESNASNAKQYFHLMNAMIKHWRDDWNIGNFTFLTVQLAPYDQPKVEGQWAELREAQLFTSKKVPSSFMAVITDAGDPKDIHPKDKEPVGERLALAARALAYKHKIVYSGPLYKSVKFEGDKAVLSFNHIGGGLEAKGGPLVGFTMAGKDGKFHKAEAAIVEGTIVVSCKDVPQPAAVRYGWANYPVVNLYNRDGLPATPFRTDAPEYK